MLVAADCANAVEVRRLKAALKAKCSSGSSCTGADIGARGGEPTPLLALLLAPSLTTVRGTAGGCAGPVAFIVTDAS